MHYNEYQQREYNAKHFRPIPPKTATKSAKLYNLVYTLTGEFILRSAPYAACITARREWARLARYKEEQFKIKAV